MNLQGFFSILFSFLILSCGEEKGKDGKINVTLNLNDSLTGGPSGSQGTTIAWGCLVMSDSETYCVYYYNGEAQVDGSISDAAASAGPGTSGFKFVANGTKVTGYEGGPREYYVKQASYLNGSETATPYDGSGTVDLYSNAGKDDGADGADINWVVTFGTAGDPVLTNE